MKKILFFLTFTFLVNNVLNSQGYPVVQQLGSNNTLIRLGTTYGGALKGNLIQGVYADTTEANTGYIDLYPGAIIFSTGNATMYVRNAAADGWIALATGLSAINIYTSDGTLTGNRTLAGVGNSLTFSGVSDFLVEDATGEIRLGTSEFNRLRISSGVTAFLSLDADSLLMTRLPQSQLLSTDSVLIRTADFKVKTRAVSSIGSTYTAGNGLTLSGSQFELGGALSKQTSITGNYKLFLNNSHTHIQGDTVYFVSNTNNLINLNSSTGLGDELLLEANGGAIRFTSVSDLYMPSPVFTGTVPSGASTDSILTVNTSTGQVRKRQLSEVVTTPTLQQVLTSGSTLTTNNEIELDGTDFAIVDNTGGSTISLVTTSGSIGLQSLQLGDAISDLEIVKDSILLKAHKGQINIDSLRTWSDIADSTYKKPMTWDTRNGRWEYAANWPQQKINLVFGAGSGADSDTTAFTTSAIYGSFYNDADTIVVTSFKAVLQGTSPDVTYKIWYNDSLNVEAGATALNTAGNQVTNTTTGTNVTSITNTKIPPGNWVWVKTGTVATKPKYFSLTLNGYRK